MAFALCTLLPDQMTVHFNTFRYDPYFSPSFLIKIGVRACITASLLAKDRQRQLAIVGNRSLVNNIKHRGEDCFLCFGEFLSWFLCFVSVLSLVSIPLSMHFLLICLSQFLSPSFILFILNSFCSMCLCVCPLKGKDCRLSSSQMRINGLINQRTPVVSTSHWIDTRSHLTEEGIRQTDSKSCHWVKCIFYTSSPERLKR